MGDSWYNHDDMQQGRASEVCVGDVWQGSLRTGDATAPTAPDVEIGLMPVAERFHARYRPSRTQTSLVLNMSSILFFNQKRFMNLFVRIL